jgi:hypothetical protein
VLLSSLFVAEWFGHSLARCVDLTQNVFAAFASVAFVKLIIFSVFEMRYLLIIWKARRPQGFSDGWLSLRRELTTLYSRFYLSLLAGLCLFYNFSVRLLCPDDCV